MPRFQTKEVGDRQTELIAIACWMIFLARFVSLVVQVFIFASRVCGYPRYSRPDREMPGSRGHGSHDPAGFYGSDDPQGW